MPEKDLHDAIEEVDEIEDPVKMEYTFPRMEITFERKEDKSDWTVGYKIKAGGTVVITTPNRVHRIELQEDTNLTFESLEAFQKEFADGMFELQQLPSHPKKEPKTPTEPFQTY